MSSHVLHCENKQFAFSRTHFLLESEDDVHDFDMVIRASSPIICSYPRGLIEVIVNKTIVDLGIRCIPS